MENVLFHDNAASILTQSGKRLDMDIAQLTESKLTRVFERAAEMNHGEFVSLKSQEIFQNKLLSSEVKLSIDQKQQTVSYPGYIPERQLKFSDFLKGRSGSYWNSVSDPENQQALKGVLFEKEKKSARHPKHGAAINYYTALAHDQKIYTPGLRGYDLEKRQDMIKEHFENVKQFAKDNDIALDNDYNFANTMTATMAMFLKPNRIQRSINDIDLSCQETAMVSEAFAQTLARHLKKETGNDVAVPAQVGRLLWEEGGDVSTQNLLDSIQEEKDGFRLDPDTFTQHHRNDLKANNTAYFHPIAAAGQALKDYGVDMHVERGYGLGFSFSAALPTHKIDLDKTAFRIEDNYLIAENGRVDLSSGTTVLLDGKKTTLEDGMTYDGSRLKGTDGQVIATAPQLSVSSDAPFNWKKELCDIVTTSSETFESINDYDNITRANNRLIDACKGTPLVDMMNQYEGLMLLTSDASSYSAKDNFESKLTMLSQALQEKPSAAKSFGMTEQQVEQIAAEIDNITGDYYQQRAFVDNIRAAEQVGQKMAQNKDFINKRQDKKVYGNYADTIEFSSGILKASVKGDEQAQALKEAMVASYALERLRWEDKGTIMEGPHKMPDMVRLQENIRKKDNPDYDGIKAFFGFLNDRCYKAGNTPAKDSIRSKLGWDQIKEDDLLQLAENSLSIQSLLDHEVKEWGHKLYDKGPDQSSVHENMAHLIHHAKSPDVLVQDVRCLHESVSQFFVNRHQTPQSSATASQSLKNTAKA